MTCIRGAEGRVLRDRHDEAAMGRGDHDACPGCLACPEQHCLLCTKAHTLVACPSCVGVARTDLRAILELSGHLEDQMVNGRAAMRVRSMPGGNALVLASPGATTHGLDGQRGHRYVFALDLSHVKDERRSDPRPLSAVLLHWEDRWRSYLAQPTDLAPTLERSAAYLDAHLHEVAGDLGFVPFARALAGTRRQLEDVLLDGERPEVTRVPCWECGVRLVKVYGESLGDDHWKCTRCGEKYDRGRFDRAKHDHLASEGAERYVHLSDAAAAIGRPRASVWEWVKAGHVRTHRDELTGRVLAYWPDIRQRHQVAKTRGAKRP